MTSIDKYKRPRKGVPKAEVVDDGHTMQPQKDNTWQQDVAEWLTPSDAGALQHVVSLVNTFGKEGGEVDQLQDVLAARAGQGHVVEQVAGDIIGAGGVAGAAKKSLDKLTPDLSDIKKWLLGTGTTSFAKEPLEATDTIPDELIERAKTAGIDLAGISAGFGVGKGAELLGNFVGGVKKGRMG